MQLLRSLRLSLQQIFHQIHGVGKGKKKHSAASSFRICLVAMTMLVLVLVLTHSKPSPSPATQIEVEEHLRESEPQERAVVDDCTSLRDLKVNDELRRTFIKVLMEPFSPETAQWWTKETARRQEPHCCWDKSPITYACDNFVPQKVHHSWPLCFDRLKSKANSKCLVYSFGIDNSWGYDDMMAKEYGCEVHSFDPTKNLKQAHENHKVPGITFHYGGLSSNFGKCSKAAAWVDERHDVMDGEMKTLAGWMEGLGHLGNAKNEGHTLILKIDCEGCEWDAFYQMAVQTPAVLEHVDLIQLELHTSPKLQMVDALDLNKFQAFFQNFFVDHGFRLWYHHNNLGNPSHRNVQPDLGEMGLSDQRCCYEIGLVKDK